LVITRVALQCTRDADSELNTVTRVEPQRPRAARGVWTLLWLSLLPAAGGAVAPPPRVPGDDAVRRATLVAGFEALADRVTASGHVVGMAAVVVDHGVARSVRGLGTADATTGTPVGADTVFRLASLSKAFAAATIVLLEAEGYLSLDDRVQDYVPSFELSDSREAAKATVRDLLSHRLGLPYNAHDRLLEKDEPYPLLVYRLREVPMTCSVGDCYAYQNVAFSLVGDVAFAATGDFFSHQVERRLFHPLGMATATYGRESLEGRADHAWPHVRRGGRWIALHPRDNFYRVVPAAGANASAKDLAQWMLAQLGHRPDVLAPDLLSRMHAPLVSTPGELGGSPWRRERVRSAHYALGWRVYDYGGHRVVFHAGAVQGFRAMLALLPDHDFGVAVVWNCESAVPSGLVPGLLDAYLGLPARDWIQLDRLAPAPLMSAGGR
jgi:beta-lactamase class C